MENEVPSDEDVAREIMKPYICTRISDVSIERKITKGIVDALSALRASLEKEKGELENVRKYILSPTQNASENVAQYVARLEAEKQALEADKKGLEERVNDLESKMNEVTNCGTWEGYVDAVRSLKKKLSEEITRLKAENEAQTYKGNSIGYIYDKMIAYQTQVFPLSNALKELGFNYPESGKDNMARERALIEWAHNKKESFDTLTLALAEARGFMTEIIKEHKENEGEIFYLCQPDKGDVFSKYDNIAVIAKDALSNPTSQRASEEMKRLREIEARMKGLENGISGKIAEYFDASTKCLKDSYLLASSEEMMGLRKVVEAARLSNKECRKWRSNPDEKPCHEFKSLVDNDLLCHGCRLMNRIEALEAYESRGKV